MYRIGLAMALAVNFVAAVAQATEVTKGNVTEVTVYRDQALITRTIEVEGPKGPLEISNQGNHGGDTPRGQGY